MKTRSSSALRIVVLIALIMSVTILSSRMRADTGSCGGAVVTLPFTDVMGNPLFCQIAAAYFSGLTNGTSATTYSPGESVSREQMAAFVTRTLDQSLKRGSRKAVVNKWWSAQTAASMTLTNVGLSPEEVAFDGTDVWVVHSGSGNVMRVRPGDGKVLDTWTGATEPAGIVAATGKVFLTGATIPGTLYMIDPTQAPGAVTTVTSGLGGIPVGVAFDGSRVWTANALGSVSIVSFNPTAVTTVSTGLSGAIGILFDGANIWVTSGSTDSLHKLNSDGSIAQTISIGDNPAFPVFDGTNIWVPNGNDSSVAVVRVRDADGNPLTPAFVLATLTGNGLAGPATAAFDGERVLVTNFSGSSVSLWKASDLSPLGSFPTGTSSGPSGACSDGLNFWITLRPKGKLARF